MPNPFKPTFGCEPYFLAGRQPVTDAFGKGLENGVGDPNRMMLITGARGTGKTALLVALGGIALERGWVVANADSGAGLLDEVYAQTLRGAGHLLEGRGKARVTGVTLSGFGLTVQPGEVARTWRTEMTDIVEELNGGGAGLLVTVDEAAHDDEELKILVRTFQHFVREGRDAALLLAGLPQEVSTLLLDRSVSFVRRAKQFQLGTIPSRDVERAIRATVEHGGKSISAEALAEAARLTHGFAYMVQLLGYCMWEEAGAEPVVAPAHVGEAAALATGDLFRNVFRPSVCELPPRELEFLRVLAQAGGRARLGAVAEAMGIQGNNASQLRRKLIERGLIVSPLRGFVALDLPFFADFLNDLENGLGA